MKSSIDNNMFGIDRRDKLEKIGFWVKIVSIFWLIVCLTSNSSQAVGDEKKSQQGEVIL